MQGKTVVITGATAGIGEVAAIALARKGARIVMTARDKARGEATLAKLNEAAPGAAHRVHYGDLSRISEMKRVANEIAAAEPKIDVLVNNAGAVFNTRQVTPDGLEMTFALDHMSYFVVTNLLLDRLKSTPGARVVSTSSTAHVGAKINFDDLQSEKSSILFAYGVAKLCNILFTRELARRLAGTGVTANCLHPGFVATNFGNSTSGLLAGIFRLAKAFAISPEKGAETIVYLASSNEVAGKSGGYYFRCAPKEPSAAAQNDADARRLWEVSAKLSGLQV